MKKINVRTTHNIGFFDFQESSVPDKEVTSNGSTERHNGFNVAAWNEQSPRFIVIGDTDPTDPGNVAEKFRAANH